MIFRKKLRYILVEASGEVNMEDSRLFDSLRDQMSAFLGHLPYFKANPQIAAQWSRSTFVMKVNRGYERDVMLAFSFIKNLDGKGVGFYTIKTSGTIRSIRSAFRKMY
jgi:RNase P/RNase MRP subunit POP5